MRKHLAVSRAWTSTPRSQRTSVSPKGISTSRSWTDRILDLQRSVGNVRVRQLLQSKRLTMHAVPSLTRFVQRQPNRSSDRKDQEMQALLSCALPGTSPGRLQRHTDSHPEEIALPRVSAVAAAARFALPDGLASRISRARRPMPPTRASGRSVRRARAPRRDDGAHPYGHLVQRTIGDGHDFPPASRFSGDAVLEGVFDNERVLQAGNTGTPVTLVQQAFIALNYLLPRFAADGTFGDETKRAVDAFQRDVGLGVDGRVGFRTIDFLDKRDRGADVAPPVRPAVANTPFPTANAIAQPGAAPSNALGPGAWGLTFPENVQVIIDVFDNGGVWQPVLTGVTGNYSLQARLLTGVTEVTGPGGNTNAGNYCPQINGLNSLVGPTWYMLAAVLEHERVHARQFRAALVHPSVIAPLETAIEAITKPRNLFTPNATAAEFFIRIDPAFTAALNAAQANWLARILVLVAGDHAPGGRTDTEEHRIVDPMRRRICQHARTNGWPACPPLCP